MPPLSKPRQVPLKTVSCTHCQGLNEVAPRAMSVFCKHCHKRLFLENYKIKSYHAVSEFSTCGDIVVERKGHVVAPIKVNNLTVKGKVQGKVQAKGRVTLSKTGSFKGDIEASHLRVENGAELNGFLRIDPSS